MSLGANYGRLPVELKLLNQWCLAGADKAPYLAGQNGLYHASPVKGPWLSFQAACEYAVQYNVGIGFIITEFDSLTCIDMDVKDAESIDPKTGQQYPKELWTSKQQLDYYAGISQFANSYTELSSSGKGLHVWVNGDIGAGRKGKGIEVYSRERFIICTGLSLSEFAYDMLNNVAIPRIITTNQLPVADGTLILQSLAQELKGTNKQIELVEIDAELTDKEVWKRATSASNSEKFIALCGGDWHLMGFPSQSEADLALMSMFTYYSKSNEQCIRMFRATVLGQRTKAVKNDVYLKRTLKIIRSRQDKEARTAEHGEQLAKALMDKFSQPPPINERADPACVVNEAMSIIQNMNQGVVVTEQPPEVHYNPPEVEGLAWPPGFVGQIAGFIYQSAPRPVKEVAIVAALGLMSGLTGKAYNIGQTGLNLYIILIARSAIGKEAMHSGIGHIMRSGAGAGLEPFVNFTDFASGPALTKQMEQEPSFVNVSGEWGRKLQRMAEDHRDGPMQQLRTVMTHLYQKSGAGSVMGGMGYSNKDNSTKSVNAVAYSMIGETTPGTFYDSLTQTMMEDGFLSRFNIIEFDGDRPAENKNQIMQFPQEMIDYIGPMASHCARVCSDATGAAIQMSYSPEAKIKIDGFNEHCDGEIRVAGADESLRQIWNRAHLKAIRVAGVLGASDNYLQPVVQEHHVDWAINLVLKDAHSMLDKVTGGEIGVDDTARYKKFLSILKDFLSGKVANSYGIDLRMIADGIVPRKYLIGRSCQVRCFRNYKLGSTLGLDHAIKNAVDSGVIMEVDKTKAVEAYNYHGRAFRILELD